MLMSVVMTLLPDAGDDVAATLARLDGVEVGQAQGAAWPLVLEAATQAELDERLQTLGAVQGVGSIDVVLFDFSSQQGEHAP